MRNYSPHLGVFLQRDPLIYKDGFNLIRGGFIPCGTDSMGTTRDRSDFGIFIDGANQWDSKVVDGEVYVNNTNIQKIAGDYGDDGADTDWKAVYSVFVGDNFTKLVKLIHDMVCSRYCATFLDLVKQGKCNPADFPRVDLFGWSRGAIAAMTVADLLNSEGCNCTWRKTVGFHMEKSTFALKPIPIRFLGLIDPVATGLAPSLHATSLPSNVSNCSVAVASEANWMGPIWKWGRVIPEGCDRKNFDVTHQTSGRDDDVLEWLLQQARNSNVPV